MAELTQEEKAPPARGPLFYIGAAGLLIAMGIETIAVVGRHLGLPLLGALEIIQAAILLMASTAMLSATLNDGHATVTLLTNHLSERGKRALSGFAAVLSALFFTGLTLGAAWLAFDAWGDHEQSELLHIPFRPLRLISVIAAGAIALVFLRDAVRCARGRE